MEEKERHAAAVVVVRGTDVKHERKDDVVDLHRVLVTADSPRDTSMAEDERPGNESAVYQACIDSKSPIQVKSSEARFTYLGEFETFARITARIA